MRTLFFVFCLGLLALGCSKKGPCNGGGMAVDQRALPAVWAASAAPPSGAVQCHQADGKLDSEYHRNFEVGESAEAGFEAWRKELTTKGWKELKAGPGEDGFNYEGEKDGHKIKVFVSKHVEGKGWCSVTFTPRKD